jgi:sialidase-1
MSRQVDWKLYEQYVRDVEHLAMKPTSVNPRVPLSYYPEVDDYAMSAGMDMTPGGRLWLAWFGHQDGSQTVLLLAWSDDEGRTFSRPRFIVDPGFLPGGLHLSAVVADIWTAPDGRLFLFFTQSIGHFDGRAGVWQSVCDNPDSESPTWSTPERIWHGAALNKPTVLANGTWLLPVALWPRRYFRLEEPSGRGLDVSEFKARNTLFADLDERRGSNILASTDGGGSWQLRGHVRNPFGPTFDEPAILERKDGSLLMYIRDTDGMIACESADEGESWSEPVRTPWQTASARFFLRRLSSGNSLLVRNANPQEGLVRSHMTAFLSRDDGATWEGGLLLDERTGVSYPDGIELADGRILVQYDRNRISGEILMATFTEDDVLAGEDVSGRVVLRQPLVQSRTARRESE